MKFSTAPMAVLRADWQSVAEIRKYLLLHRRQLKRQPSAVAAAVVVARIVFTLGYLHPISDAETCMLKEVTSEARRFDPTSSLDVALVAAYYPPAARNKRVMEKLQRNGSEGSLFFAHKTLAMLFDHQERHAHERAKYADHVLHGAAIIQKCMGIAALDTSRSTKPDNLKNATLHRSLHGQQVAGVRLHPFLAQSQMAQLKAFIR